MILQKFVRIVNKWLLNKTKRINFLYVRADGDEVRQYKSIDRLNVDERFFDATTRN